MTAFSTILSKFKPLSVPFLYFLYIEYLVQFVIKNWMKHTLNKKLWKAMKKNAVK